jgi:hypothetical protein
MVPQIIVERLAAVRRKENAVSTAWGLGRWAGLAVAAMLGACLLDWLIDRRTDTPGGLRVLLLLAQLALWAGAGWGLVLRPLLRARDDREVALWVEEKFPELGHRVISAVELNAPAADTKGMSPELIAATTRQAEERARAAGFEEKVLLNRWRRSDGWLAGAAGLALVFAVAAPATVGALVARQFLADRDVPRSVRIASETPQRVCPSGEEVVLRFRVSAAGAGEGWEGEVEVRPDGRSIESYPLVFKQKAADGEAVFAAVVPPSSVNFDYRAWLGDGRTRRPARIDYEPRPVVKKVDAWILLPKYAGARPDGSPYEQMRPRGEVAGPKGSSARVAIEIQKPIVKGVIEFLGRGTEQAPEPVIRRIELALLREKREAQAVFDLRPEEVQYRVLVEDRHGFANSTPPKRSISIVPDEPPRAVLLPERFVLPGEEVATEDTEVEGAPIPIGSAIRIAYYAAHPYGLDRARMAYRIIKAGQQSGDVPPAASETDWLRLPLGEVHETEESGPFDLRRGLFKNSGFRDQVEFHPVPTPDPGRVPGRLEAGGCFDFQTRAIKGLQVGDQIEFFVEVFARNPDLAKQPGRSETRLKAFVTQPQFVDWVLQTLKHESRIRQLESRQRGVFAPEGADR